jgi:hypothetical protein
LDVLSIPMTVIETPGFIREAANAFTDPERLELIGFLAANPEAGELMAGTGGGRKLRWKAAGRGKRGGVRVVYYYHNESLPLFLISVFAKNEKANLTKAEQNEMRALLPRLAAGYRKRMGT